MDSDCEGPPRAAIRQVRERMEDALLAGDGVIGVDIGDGVVDRVLGVRRSPAGLFQTTTDGWNKGGAH